MHHEAISQWCSKLILDVPWQTVKNQSITPSATQGRRIIMLSQFFPSRKERIHQSSPATWLLALPLDHSLDSSGVPLPLIYPAWTSVSKTVK